MDILLVVNGNCVFNFLQWAEERKVKVFQNGERVVCGSKGVCVVEEITTLDIAGVDKKREYYNFKTSVSVFQYGIYSGGYGRRFHAESACT